MLLATAQLLALYVGVMLTLLGQRHKIDWHSQRGLSFLQLGLREIERLCYLGLPIPPLLPLPLWRPPPACASQRKREMLDCRIEFPSHCVWSVRALVGPIWAELPSPESFRITILFCTTKVHGLGISRPNDNLTILVNLHSVGGLPTAPLLGVTPRIESNSLGFQHRIQKATDTDAGLAILGRCIATGLCLLSPR